MDIMKLIFGFFLLIYTTHFANGTNVVRGPKGATVVESQAVQLDCIFNTEIDCAWLRNDQNVKIADRLQYTSGDGTSTTDCSITINPVLHYDHGSWQCLSTADSDGNPSVKSQIVRLSVQDLKVIKQASDVSVVESESAEIECELNAAANCMWYKDGSVIKVHGRYKYKMDTAENGLSNDCSIIINPVEIFDVGDWKCGNIGNDKFSFITSDKIQLNVEALKILEQSKSILYVTKGENVQLHCNFNTKIDCNWMRNGEEMNVDDHYIELSSRGKNTKHCSIMLLEVTRDEYQGNWTCKNKATDDATKQIHSQVAEVIITDSANGILVVRGPNSATAFESQSIELDCNFNTKVDCAWLRNDNHIEIAARYKYTNEYGLKTSDCSITINPVIKLDNGPWQCASMADSDGNPSVKSQTVWLNVQDIKVIQQSSDVSVVESETVELECVFNTPVECIWYHNESAVDITDRYKYRMDTTENGLSTDCTIIINAVEIDDAGNWHCANIGNDKRLFIISNEMKLSVDALKILEQSKPILNVIEGETVVLDCEFNTNIDCNWIKDGEDMNVDDDYIEQSSRGKNTKHCSIKLLNVKRDVHEGNWTCNNKITLKIIKPVSQLDEVKVTEQFKAKVETEDSTEDVSTSNTGFIIAIVILALALIALIALISGFMIYKFKLIKKPGNESVNTKTKEENASAASALLHP